ncbi:MULTISPECIES: Gfo/Idh/MocA family protein [Bacillaceae]|uniref:Gfo/Idh/MocA family oxidoreductase n=1 Tax=Evansella alkalicola TaxID=745819 RepID=A0ABS6JSN2_9BACI|nr:MULTISPECIES: Gfo/Idh/MocA family oxidoreductase [Bacillaceae]MBU9721577.1 Gfo/Idh/MocA family oxidoreductase [Bacillus alkalicola]
MKSTGSIVLVGMSGYGNRYLTSLLQSDAANISIAGVVDIQPQRSDYYHEIVQRKIPIYHSLEQFYDGNEADLAIICTPIHLHAEQSCFAMEHGSHVLCEKPMTGDSQDIAKIIETSDRTGKFFAVGFNWSFTESVQQLKNDIMSGVFGKAQRVKSIVLWPRDHAYYNRSSWAGKKYGPNGEKIFDSVANNATAHFLHHLLYILGDETSKSAALMEVTAELYKVNPIETFDTCAVHIKANSNVHNEVEIYYYASHAANEHLDPTFELEFENATITYGNGTNEIVATFLDGSKKVYEDPGPDDLAKLQVCVTAIQDANHDILCGAEAATAHVHAIEKIHLSVMDIPVFPNELQRISDDNFQWVEGLGDIMKTSYDKWQLPSDLGIDWSVRGRKIKV